MHLSLTTDDVACAQRGDARALDRLTRALVPEIAGFLRRFSLSPADREEALQNALLQVLRSLGSYRQEARFTTWLYRLCTNEALMVMRKVRSHQTRHTEVSVEDALERVRPESTHADQLEVRQALETLPAHYREALWQHYAEGRDLREIADDSVESESAVRARVHRARRLLRERLEQDGSELTTSDRPWAA